MQNNTPFDFLAVDIGNTRTKLGWFIQDVFQTVTAFPTTNDYADYQCQWEAALSSDIRQHLNGMVVASVVPQAQSFLQHLLQDMPFPILWLDRRNMDWLLPELGVDITTYADGELGMDRIANITAGHFLFPHKQVLVCSFGTTSTFDLVDSQGRYHGGAIAPGALKFQELVDSSQAAQLFQVDVFQTPEITPGCSTSVSLQNGLYFGYQGVVLNVIQNLLSAAGWPAEQVVMLLTGGNALSVQPMLDALQHRLVIDQSLTLQGLQILYRLHRQAQGYPSSNAR